MWRLTRLVRLLGGGVILSPQARLLIATCISLDADLSEECARCIAGYTHCALLPPNGRVLEEQCTGDTFQGVHCRGPA